MIKFVLCVLLPFAIYINRAWSQNFEGDYCLIKRTGESGICKLLEHCPGAITELQSNKGYPQTCGFQSNSPIVCCSQDSDAVTYAPTTLTKASTASIISRTTTRTSDPSPKSVAKTTTKPKTTQHKQIGEKANQKCKNYAQYAYVVVKNSLTGTSETIIRTECQSSEPLIVGGNHARPKEFPHMASVGFRSANNAKVWLCGGSLISDSFVLTSAPCVSNKLYGEAKYIRLRIGDLDKRSDSEDSQSQELNVFKVFTHPQYKAPSQYHDIGLIQMEKKATLNSYVKPICINTAPLTTKQATASSWGGFGYTSDISNPLLKTSLSYVSNSECNSSYRNLIGRRFKYGIVPETQVCARSGKLDCQGNSGDPLQVKNYDQVLCTYKLVGVASIPKPCGAANLPGVYTLISAYTEWIENVVWP